MPQTIPGSGVRPTRSALDDLDLPVPDLGVALEDIDHELVARAQQLPERVAAGGAARILALDDLIWFKVKTEVWRGAVTRHAVGPRDDGAGSEALGCWWLGAAGTRRQDSGQDDFYEQLERSCVARRKSANATGAAVRTTTLSTHLLPASWDVDRLSAELATHARRAIQRVVRDMATESLRAGRVIGFDFEGHRVKLLIRAREDSAYIAIGASAFTDATTFALLLGSIPGIQTDDWMPEPGGVAGFQPDHGEILWSAVLSPESQALLLDTEE